MSANDSSRAHRIAKRLKNHQKITREEREFLVDYRRLRSRRGKAAPEIEIPAAEECEDALAVETATETPAPAAGSPPPLTVDLSDTPPTDAATSPAPAPSSPDGKPVETKPDLKKPETKKPSHVATNLGKQVTEMYLQAVGAWNKSIEAKGGTPYPDILLKASALSAGWLADEYLAPTIGESAAVHFFNAGMPIAWNVYYNRKGAKKPSVDLADADEPVEERTIDDVAKKHAAPESPIPPTAAPPKKPTLVEVVTQDKTRDAVMSAVGVGGDSPP